MAPSKVPSVHKARQALTRLHRLLQGSKGMPKQASWIPGAIQGSVERCYSQHSVSTQSTLQSALQSALADVYKNIPFCTNQLFLFKILKLYNFYFFKVNQADFRQMVHFYTFQRVLTVVLTVVLTEC